MRSSAINMGQNPSRTYKENVHPDFYMLDPKIVDLKKKYQLEPRASSGITSAYRQTTTSRQQQVLRKLENIKSELQLIPDWQNVARSILFDGQVQPDLRKELTKESFKLESKYCADNQIREENETFQESRVLTNSNISFKVNKDRQEFKQIKPFNNYMDRHNVPVTPTKTGTELLKNTEATRSNKSFLKDKSKLEGKGGVDEKINEISRKIREAELKKQTLGVDFIPFEQKSANGHKDLTSYPSNEYKSRTPDYQPKKNTCSIDKFSLKPKQTNISRFNDDFSSKNSVPISEDYSKDTSARFAQNQTRFTPQQPLFSHKQHHAYQNDYHYAQHEARYPKHQVRFGTSENWYANDTRYVGRDVGFEKEKTSFNIADSQQEGTKNEMMKKGRTFSAHDDNPKPKLGYQRVNKYANEDEAAKGIKMVQKAEEALKERKKKVEKFEEPKKRSKENTKKLVQAFCDQVKLDDKFRNCKLWFKAYKNDKKMQRLRSLLELQGISVNDDKIISDFEVQEKEDNPFFSVTSQQCDVEEVVKCYIESQKFWKKNLYKRFNRESMEAEDFTNLSIDLDKKGYIVLEDLVRFLNMETGTFFRNRDLFTIFKRLSKNSGKVSFKDFISNFYA